MKTTTCPACAIRDSSGAPDLLFLHVLAMVRQRGVYAVVMNLCDPHTRDLGDATLADGAAKAPQRTGT